MYPTRPRKKLNSQTADNWKKVRNEIVGMN